MNTTTKRTSYPRWRGRAAVWSVLVAVAFVLAMVPMLAWDQPGIVRAQIDSGTLPPSDGVPATTPAIAGTPAAGTPVPVSTATGSTSSTAAPPPAPADGQNGADGKDGKDGAAGQPGQDGQDGQAGADAASTDSDRAVEKDGKGSDGDRKKDHDRERDANRGRDANGRDSNGNGGVADVVAYPPDYTQPQQIDLEQQDGTNSTAGATGQNGTVNGEPRETPVNEPVTTTGPGAPLAPGEVTLPPSVPGLPDPATVDPALAAGVAGTTELMFDAVADTTVFTSAPDSPQTPESAGLLAFGGPDGAITLISFEVSGVGDGSVLAARLTFLGAGSSGAPGGGVGVIYDYIAKDGLTANKAPAADSAMSVQGTPSWFERVEPGALGAVDVSGSVYGDGRITFVLTGQPEQTALIDAMESGAPPQLILTVGLPG